MCRYDLCRTPVVAEQTLLSVLTWTLDAASAKNRVSASTKKRVLKKRLDKEVKAFPETHLVLMQGLLVWITGTYYRRTPGDPLISIPGEIGASHGNGG